MVKKDKKNEKKYPQRLLSRLGFLPDQENYATIARSIAVLLEEGRSEASIVAELKQTYGLPEPRFTVRSETVQITYFGDRKIDFEPVVFEQIEKAARLPVAVTAAVMPDGHPGYALPIGGVIALDNAVSPSFVGYDIACRMTLSLLDIPVEKFLDKRRKFAASIQAVTSFGVGAGFHGQERRRHPVMEDPLWHDIVALRQFRELAWNQLGSSGGGNHFVDALVGEVLAPAEWMPLPVGAKFVALMSHSGSRGTGNKLAQHYQKIAAAETRAIASGIPGGYEWLPLDREAGQEYWAVMQLMGRYAQASHHLIHDLFLEESGLGQLARWENHHNFAFLEDGLVVHRKGATPAEKGRVGIIPGSSGAASYLVEGLGNPASLNSSSHGAGRPRSRTESRRRHDEHAFREHMKRNDILHIGVEPDETYMAYKDIERVMAVQDGVLVRTIARLKPVIVLMGGKSDDGD